jgi:hypothetical protein
MFLPWVEIPLATETRVHPMMTELLAETPAVSRLNLPDYIIHVLLSVSFLPKRPHTASRMLGEGSSAELIS